MVYKTSDVHLFIAIILLLLVPFSLSARESVSASSYLLVEKDTFQVISGRDYDQKRAPASTTKVLTTIVALEKLQGNETLSRQNGIENSRIKAQPDSR